MIQKSTIDFLKKLKKNNSKEWMDANRNMYLEAKADFEALTEELMNGLVKMGVDIEGQTAKSCIFRINRDIRFSKNKDPYKTNMGAAMVPGGKKSNNAGYYFHLMPGANFIGGGNWMPMPDKLKAIRQEINYNWKDFKKIINNKSFIATFGAVSGDKLVNPPKGYEADNPAVEYLKLKSYTISTTIDDEKLTQKDLVKNVLNTFKTMQPFIDFLNTSD